MTDDLRREAILRRATYEALSEARWESCDVLSRRPSDLAPDLLRGHSAELATSPIARDQVLSIALEATARDLDEGRAPSGEGALAFFKAAPPSEALRKPIRDSVLDLRPGPIAVEAAAATAELEERHRVEAPDVFDLAARLKAEAELQEALWDDPRLPAEPAVRLVMMQSASHLRARAETLERTARRKSRLRDLRQPDTPEDRDERVLRLGRLLFARRRSF